MIYSCEECKNKDTSTCTVCANYNGFPDKFEPRARTNGDLFRASTDEELAVILSVLTQDAFYSMSIGNTHITRARFADYHTALEWLKQEVEE